MPEARSTNAEDRSRALLSVMEDLQAERRRLAHEVGQRRAAEEQARSIIDSTLDAVVAMDEAGRIVDWNPPAVEMFGFSYEEVIGQDLAELLLPPDLRSGHRLALNRYRESGESKLLGRLIETTALHRGGCTFPVETSITALDTPEGVRFYAFVRDITNRRRLLNEIRDSRDQFRLILDSTAEAIYGVDLNGDCTFCNQACVTMLGYEDVGDLLGRNMHALVHHTRADGTPYPPDQCRIYEAFRRGERVHVDDEVFWRCDGTSFPVEYWSQPILQQGELIGCEVTFLDVTERKRGEDELRAAKEEAERANRTRGEFMANVSHELRTPMSAILGMTQLALEENLDDPLREYIQTAQDSAHSLLALLNDILDFPNSKQENSASRPSRFLCGS